MIDGGHFFRTPKSTAAGGKLFFGKKKRLRRSSELRRQGLSRRVSATSAMKSSKCKKYYAQAISILPGRQYFFKVTCSSLISLLRREGYASYSHISPFRASFKMVASRRPQSQPQQAVAKSHFHKSRLFVHLHHAL